MDASQRNDNESLTHLDETGAARMVDVGEKEMTLRRALAGATVRMGERAFAALRAGTLAKGDAIAVARVAGIMAAKRTHELIPLCHPLPLTSVNVAIDLDPATHSACITAEARVTGRTGVEMEALTAAGVAALTLYDMVKGVDRGTLIENIMLLEKSGGRSGEWRAEDEQREEK